MGALIYCGKRGCNAIKIGTGNGVGKLTTNTADDQHCHCHLRLGTAILKSQAIILNLGARHVPRAQSYSNYQKVIIMSHLRAGSLAQSLTVEITLVQAVCNFCCLLAPAIRDI